jgi:hypothetical protein
VKKSFFPLSLPGKSSEAVPYIIPLLALMPPPALFVLTRLESVKDGLVISPFAAPATGT